MPTRREKLYLCFAWALAILTLSLIRCTVPGSSCGDEDACPTGWACVSGKCEPPPAPGVGR